MFDTSITCSSPMLHNAKNGFLEGALRGCHAGLLSTHDYSKLILCETLDDVKTFLCSTDYCSLLQDLPSPLLSSTIATTCTQKWVDEFNAFRSQAAEPLGTFLDFLTYGHMIDNVVLLVTGALHERGVHEMLPKCHPLGTFDAMASMAVANNMRIVIIETPLAPYFSQCLKQEDLDEMNVEIMRNILYKAYLHDFTKFCEGVGGITATLMTDILGFEADKQAIILTINSLSTDLSRNDRHIFFPEMGSLYPDGHRDLVSCNDFGQVQTVMEMFASFEGICTRLRRSNDISVEKTFSEEEMKKCHCAFKEHFNLASFYAYMKLREQELRNLMWITECIAQDQKDRIIDGLVDVGNEQHT